MLRSLFRASSGFLLLALFCQPVFGQDFFGKLETAEDYWKALNFEINVGRFEIAAVDLIGFVGAEPKEKEKSKEQLLLDLEKEHGMSAFLRLRNIDWVDVRRLKERVDVAKADLKQAKDTFDEKAIIPAENALKAAEEAYKSGAKLDKDARDAAEKLIEQVSTALKKHLADPVRIAKFAIALSASPEERIYAIAELRRSGALAIPEIIHILRESIGQPGHIAVVTALPRLRDDTVPPLLAALDVENPILQEELIGALMQRDDFLGLARRPSLDPRPYLYYIAAAQRTPDRLRKKVYEALSLLEGVIMDRTPNARTEVVKAAEAYYGHKIKFTNPEAVQIWRWTGTDLTMSETPASQAEEYFGLYFARKALDLDPNYERAQIVFLSIAVDKAVEQSGLDKPLAEGAPKVRELLATINPELVITALDRAISDRRTPLVLGLVRALGDQHEVKAARPRSQGQSILVKAMNYPDRRVQYAAAESVLRIGGTPAPQGAARVVEVLRRNATIEPTPKAIVADFNRARAEAVSGVLQNVGFQAVPVQTGRQLLDRLKQAGDIDIVLIDHEIFQPELLDLLTQLRADVDWAAIPLIITIPPTSPTVRQPETSLRLSRLAGNYRNVSVIPATLDPDVLKPLLPAKIAEAMGTPFTDAERKGNVLASVDWLRKLATGEVPGYDVRPAETAIITAMRSPDEALARPAVQAAGRVPTRTMQRELANMVLNEKVPAPIRALAAGELNRSIQQIGRVLSKADVAALTTVFQASEDAALKNNLALVFGSMRPDAVQTADRLKQYQPGAAAPAPAPMPKEGEKEKDKEKEKEKEKEDKDK